MVENTAETGAQACAGPCPLSRAFESARAMKEGVKRLLPPEFWEHRRAARRESLLALRSLIDAALAKTEPAPVRKATRIKVE